MGNSPLVGREGQLTGFYVIETSFIKYLIAEFFQLSSAIMVIYLSMRFRGFLEIS